MSLEADYFITENGLPNILLNSSKNRHSTMIRKTSTTSHDNQQTSNTVQVPHRNISRSISKSIKDSLNNRIKDGSSSCKKTTEILSTSKSTTTTKSDNESNRNFKRHKNHETKKKEEEVKDNKVEYQRKYDNPIFRHDLPDRIILPPLPI